MPNREQPRHSERDRNRSGELLDAQVKQAPISAYTCPMQRPPTPAFGPQTSVSRQPPIPILDGMMEKALKHHRQGALPEAERLYRRILTIDPRHAASLHLLGTLAHQVGRRDVAAQLIRAAINIDPRHAAFHCNLGAVLQAQGALDEAAGAYREALDRDPNLAEAHMNLGTILNLQGKPEQAASRFRAALALKPGLAEAHMNLGSILQAQGKLAEALSSHERALNLKPDFAEACFNRANALQGMGHLDEAVKGYQQALALKPGMPQAHGNLGNTFQAQQRLDEAAASYERALALMPDYAEAHYNLGNVRQAQALLAEAVSCYQRALALKPDLPEAHYNLGNAFQAQDHLEAAGGSFERAIALRPAYAEAHYNLGCIRQQQGSLTEALASMQQSLALKPDYAQARFGLALAQIQSGDFATGWRNYESRWQSIDHDTPMRSYPQPLWTGETLPTGRLLLWGEQGIGDEIMFAGLIPDALRTGNQITLECDPRLQPLFARSFPQIEVISAPQSGAECAAHLPTGSLPRLFRTTEEAFAASISPYLKPDAIAREHFRADYADGRRLIGLAWQTKNAKTGRKRSINLAQFAPLFALSGFRWISLQYGDFDDLEREAKDAGVPLLIDHTVDQFADIDRFAAQVAAMDQIVAIDNSTAHLAGALALPTQLLLPFACDWRWLQNRARSPWYPSIRIFRQPATGDWTSAISALRKALTTPLQ